jgi:23S rRNA-/tRNA-specific pseudouridylate synthase
VPEKEISLEIETHIAPVEAAGWRLDQFLVGELDGVSRSRVQQLIEQGEVLVEGKREKASFKLRGGEAVTVQASSR